MMVEVTQEDREAAKQHQQRFLTEGASETSLLWEAFARHRIAAEQRGKLEGARLALEAAAAKVREIGLDYFQLGYDDGEAVSLTTEQSIRALDPAKIVEEG